MAIIFTIAFLFFYFYGLFLWNRKVLWRLSPTISKTIKYIHYGTFLISASVIFLYIKYHIGLRGLWTTRIFIIITLITGMFFILLSDKMVMNKIEKIYFRIFSFLPVFTAGFLYIPFLGVVLVFSLFGQLISPADKIYFQDNKLRIQSSFVGVLGSPRLDIFEKKGIFEKHYLQDDYRAAHYDSIKVHYDIDSTRIILYPNHEYDDSIRIICLEKIK